MSPKPQPQSSKQENLLRPARKRVVGAAETSRLFLSAEGIIQRSQSQPLNKLSRHYVE